MEHKSLYTAAVILLSIIIVCILTIVDMHSPNSYIIYNLRIPRLLSAFFIGAGLSINGAVFQSMFKNDLATPYTLGTASGAAFGVVLYLQVGIFFYGGEPISAFLGAIGATLLVYIFGMASGGSSYSLLLSGVAINFFFSSLILFVQYIGDYALSFTTMRWMMGNLEVVGYNKLYLLLPTVIITFFAVYFLHRELNLWSISEDFAQSRGVNIERLRLIFFVLVSISTGILVSLCGPIGFIGMIVPHMMRLVIGADHKWLLPASFFAGGAFLSLSDLAGRIIIAPTEIPIGVITALIGGPFFLWLLVKNKRMR